MITFHNVTWSNFISTGNKPTTIVLDEHKTTLITGSNGSGKSTIMDAIAFALFNKPFRKINKPQLVNAINEKKMLVEVEFSSAGSRWKVVRGMKPNIFEIHKNGSLIEQDAMNRDYQEFLEKQVIKMSFKTFLQIVILGSANWTAFMSLKSADRRRVIEDLLDIEVFSIMNILLKERFQTNKENQTVLDKHIAILDNTLKLNQKHRKEQENKQQQQVENKRQTIEVKRAENVRLEAAAEALNPEIKELHAEAKRLKSEESWADQRMLKRQKEDKIEKIKEHVKFYEDHDKCPVCSQNIDSEFQNNTIKRSSQKIAALEKEIDFVKKRINEIKIDEDKSLECSKKCSAVITKQSELHHKIDLNVLLINSIQKDIDDLTDDQVVVDDTETLEKRKKAQIVDSKLSVQRELFTQAQKLLKDDGIKTHIIQQYIPIMNTLINKYLERMDFFCKFQIDENFDEQIETTHHQIFTYDSFSEGEKMRIDLALLFTWREISRMRNTSPCNLLILDEIMDSSLDASGTDEFIEIISQLTGDNNVIIISHKTEQISEKFDRILTVEKKKNFSRITE